MKINEVVNVYVDLKDFLMLNLPGYSKETLSYRLVINRLLTFAFRPHWVEETGVAITVELLKALNIDDRAFHIVNSKYNLFASNNSWVIGSHSKIWHPQPIIADLLAKYNTQVTGNRLIAEDANGNKTDFANVKGTVQHGHNIQPTIPINVDAVLSELVKLHKQDKPNEHHIIYLNNILALSRSSPVKGTLPNLYAPCSTGRMCGIGTSIQRMPRSIRKAVYSGWYDYDMVCAHPTLLSQQAGNYPYLDLYVNNTAEVRRDLSESLGISIDEVKKCLLAVTYGSPSSTSPYNTITKYIGKEKATLFWESNFVKMYTKDVMAAGEALVAKMGKLKGKTQVQSAAHHLQSIESKCLKAIIKKYPGRAIGLYFDGFLLNEELDTSDLEAICFEATGYNIKWSKTLL